MTLRLIAALAGGLALTACAMQDHASEDAATPSDVSSAPTATQYTPPIARSEDVGMVSLRPYPDAEGVCDILADTDTTAAWMQEGRVLVGCSVSYDTDIARLKDDGFRQMAQVGGYVVLRSGPIDAYKSTAHVYTRAEGSGLRPLQPVPGPGHVCRAIGETPAVQDWLDHSTQLIACPAHETGAIADRMRDGATREGRVGYWIVMSLPAES